MTSPFSEADCVRRMRRSTAAARSFGSGGLTRNSWMPARMARSITFGLLLRGGADDGGVALTTNLPLEGRQLQVGDTVEREDHEVDVLLAKLIDRLGHGFQLMDLREPKPGEHLRRLFVRSGRASNKQCLSCHISSSIAPLDALRLALLVGRQTLFQRLESWLRGIRLEPHDVLGTRPERIDDGRCHNHDQLGLVLLEPGARKELTQDRNVFEQRDAGLDTLIRVREQTPIRN